MQRLKEKFSCETIDKWIYWSMILLALASCNSEPLSRNMARIIFVLTAFRLWLDCSILTRLKNYKTFAVVYGVYILSLLIGVINSGNFMREFTHAAFFYHYNVLLIFVAGLIITDKKKIIFLVGCMLFSIFILDVRMIYKGLSAMKAAGHYVRIDGVERSSYFTQSAMFYNIFIPVMLIALLKEKIFSLKGKIIIFVLLIASLEAFLFTGVRGAWLGVVVALLYAVLFYVRNTKQVMVMLLVSGLLTGGLIAYQPYFKDRILSIGARAELSRDLRFAFFQSAINMWKDYPVLGIGMGNYPKLYYEKYILPEATNIEQKFIHCHNNFLQFLAEEGIVGFLAFSALTLYLLYWGWRNRKNEYGMTVLLVTLSGTIFGLSDYTYTDHQAWRIFYLLLGLCIKGAELESESENLPLIKN